MKEVIVRTISGVLYISIVIFSMFTSREGFMLLFFILGFITLREYLKLIHLKSYLSYALLAVFLYFLSYNIIEIRVVYVFLVITCLVNLILLKDLFSTNKVATNEKKAPIKYLSVIFYLISGFVFLTLIPVYGSSFMPNIIIGVFVLIWSSDTFAYIIGKSFGKRKLLERVSPKKTVEGFLGGLIGAICASFVIFKYIGHFDQKTWIMLAIIASVFGTIGDLIQSKFKRQAGVKDSGVLIPGHGGLYDRLDSMVYASPFIFAFIVIVNYVS